MKALIDDQQNKNSFLLDKIKEAGLPQITIAQLNNLKSRFKAKNGGNGVATIGAIQDWCDERKEVPDDDTVFCAGFDYEINAHDGECERFRVFLTQYGDHVATDGTYKLNWMGYPLLQVGTTDLARHFHPFGAMLTKIEDGKDYKYMFYALKRASERILGTTYNPRILLADCSPSITNGFIRNFGVPEKRIHCWAHVSRAIDNELKTFKDIKAIINQIRTDITNFQHYAENKNFVNVARLMISKWKAKFTGSILVQNFIKYFQNVGSCLLLVHSSRIIYFFFYFKK